MGNKDRVKIWVTLHIALNPLIPVGIVLYVFLVSAGSNVNSDSAGWAIISFLILGIAMLPFILVSAIPVILFLVSTGKRKRPTLSTFSLLLSGLFFTYQMYIYNRLASGIFKGITSFLLIAAIVYICTSVFIIFYMKKKEKEDYMQ